MNYVDEWILDLTERICQKFQLLTGRTNIWLAVQLTNVSIIVYFVWAGLYFWTSDDLSVRMFIGLFCGGVLYVLSRTILKEPIEAYEKSAYLRIANGARNPRRIRDAQLRVSFLTLSVVLLQPIVLVYMLPPTFASVKQRMPLIVLSYSLIVLTTVVLYVLACDPLPPCPSAVRERVRAFVRSLAPARYS